LLSLLMPLEQWTPPRLPRQQHMLPFSIDSYCPPKTLVREQFQPNTAFVIAVANGNRGNNIQQENIVFFDYFDNGL
jgi:hypothetical protein